MELVKKEIQTSMLRASKYTQLTVDEDFKVPDAMKDIEKVITYVLKCQYFHLRKLKMLIQA